MKPTLKTFFALLALLFAMSCKKENSNLQSSSSTTLSSAALSADAETNAQAVTVIKIGKQRWMAKNLSVARYRNGDKIPQVKNPAAWAGLTTGAWCWYNNDPANDSSYGRLYNYYAVADSRGLAPTGWHIPSDSEWTTLSTFLGGDAVAGGKMKEAGTAHWLDPNTGATNSSGFTALPGGLRQGGGFYILGSWGSWWSSTPGDNNMIWGRFIFGSDVVLGRGLTDKTYGYSVRCVKD
ncbi:MAG TPA: fibrobacter succinogenes major paralogous domain-containing protein [Panacibacter sp.]|nr:fibrobacter succinogenes major paralogous domain-containing protein [Panacibacter sp.]HNP44167.1 fibrobacter succinogenes major paralogous domain-containing protein [Panacibacter sp.]